MAAASPSPVVPPPVATISEQDQVAAELITFFGGKIPPVKIAQLNPLSVSKDREGLVQLAVSPSLSW